MARALLDGKMPREPSMSVSVNGSSRSCFSVFVSSIIFLLFIMLSLPALFLFYFSSSTLLFLLSLIFFLLVVDWRGQKE